MSVERIERELAILGEGCQIAQLITSSGRTLVLYRNVPTSGPRFSLPEVTDVIVPVPPGYPAALIDLAGLPLDLRSCRASREVRITRAHSKLTAGFGSLLATIRTTEVAVRLGTKRVMVFTLISIT